VTTFREYRDRLSGPEPVEQFAASLPKVARPYQGERAGFMSRAIAAGIDVAMVFIVVLGTVALIWMLSFIVSPTTPLDSSGHRIPDVIWLVLYGYFLNWAYWTICWATSGRTLGNLVMGVRVVSRKGKHMRWGGAALRSLFCTTFPIGLAWVIFSGANRSVQDVFLRTSVIYDWIVGMPTLGGILGRQAHD